MTLQMRLIKVKHQQRMMKKNNTDQSSWNVVELDYNWYHLEVEEHWSLGVKVDHHWKCRDHLELSLTSGASVCTQYCV